MTTTLAERDDTRNLQLERYCGPASDVERYTLSSVCDDGIPRYVQLSRAELDWLGCELLKIMPDTWFPRGKWATIQAVQGRMAEHEEGRTGAEKYTDTHRLDLLERWMDERDGPFPVIVDGVVTKGYAMRALIDDHADAEREEGE